MSQWRIAVRALYGMPTRPAATLQIEHAAGQAVTDVKAGLERARALGLVQSERKGIAVLWWLTPKGMQWCRGGAIESHPDRRTGGHGRRMTFAANWAAPLAAFGPASPGFMSDVQTEALAQQEQA